MSFTTHLYSGAIAGILVKSLVCYAFWQMGKPMSGARLTSTEQRNMIFQVLVGAAVGATAGSCCGTFAAHVLRDAFRRLGARLVAISAATFATLAQSGVPMDN